MPHMSLQFWQALIEVPSHGAGLVYIGGGLAFSGAVNIDVGGSGNLTFSGTIVTSATTVS